MPRVMSRVERLANTAPREKVIDPAVDAQLRDHPDSAVRFHHCPVAYTVAITVRITTERRSAAVMA